jgi:hypothetical protein
VWNPDRVNFKLLQGATPGVEPGAKRIGIASRTCFKRNKSESLCGGDFTRSDFIKIY